MKLVFTCQAGELEQKAGLLAASLRNALGRDVVLVAASPEPGDVWGTLSQQTRDVLRELSVEHVTISQPFGRTYPIANKIAALVAAGPDPALLLDTDIVCLAPPPLTAFERADMAAKPADVSIPRAGDNEWRSMYMTRNMKPPVRRVLTTVSEDVMYPYFNAGVVYARSASVLGKQWMALCEDIYSDVGIQFKFPWLDQLALPLAVHKLDWRFHALSELWNYPAHQRTLERCASQTPIFVHYHNLNVLTREPELVAHVQGMVQRFPSLRAVMEAHEGWAAVVQSQPNRPVANVLITGIPRSGAGLLRELVNQQPGSVAVNDPPRASKGLGKRNYGEFLLTQYAALRRDVMSDSGRRLHESTVRRDVNTDGDEARAACSDVRRHVSSLRLLGTTNTLVYLSRLSSLRDVRQHLHVVACVRDPRQTISSWTRSCRHLAVADVQTLIGEGLLDVQRDADRRRMMEIDRLRDPRVRRALLWRHLAIILREHRDWVSVFRLEDVVTQPRAQLAQLLVRCGGARSDQDVMTSVEGGFRASSLEMDPLEESVIADLCGREAAEFGYEL